MFKLFQREKVDLNELISGGAKIIDVRSKQEFRSGHAKGSVNWPLQDISNWCQKLDCEKPVILVCKSGMRAGVAKRQLKSMGITAHNAGAWQNVAR